MDNVNFKLNKFSGQWYCFFLFALKNIPVRVFKLRPRGVKNTPVYTSQQSNVFAFFQLALLLQNSNGIVLKYILRGVSILCSSCISSIHGSLIVRKAEYQCDLLILMHELYNIYNLFPDNYLSQKTTRHLRVAKYQTDNENTGRRWAAL